MAKERERGEGGTDMVEVRGDGISSGECEVGE